MKWVIMKRRANRFLHLTKSIIHNAKRLWMLLIFSKMFLTFWWECFTQGSFYSLMACYEVGSFHVISSGVYIWTLPPESCFSPNKLESTVKSMLYLFIYPFFHVLLGWPTSAISALLLSLFHTLFITAFYYSIFDGRITRKLPTRLDC